MKAIQSSSLTNVQQAIQCGANVNSYQGAYTPLQNLKLGFYKRILFYIAITELSTPKLNRT